MQEHDPLIDSGAAAVPGDEAAATAARAVLPQPCLTAEDQARLRAASQDALRAFRRKLAEPKP